MPRTKSQPADSRANVQYTFTNNSADISELTEGTRCCEERGIRPQITILGPDHDAGNSASTLWAKGVLVGLGDGDLLLFFSSQLSNGEIQGGKVNVVAIENTVSNKEKNRNLLRFAPRLILPTHVLKVSKRKSSS